MTTTKTTRKLTRGEFIQVSILLVGAGLFWEAPNGAMFYWTGLDMVWYHQDTWFVNGEYGPDPHKLI